MSAYRDSLPESQRAAYDEACSSAASVWDAGERDTLPASAAARTGSEERRALAVSGAVQDGCEPAA